jgi:uncharacterized protein YecE (DUF72 family)
MTGLKSKAGTIRVGIGGWTYEPWRNNFFPAGLKHAEELAYASRHVTSIEVNGTYYRTQSPESFRRWAAETPDDFVFSLKASRYATNRKDLAEAEPAIVRFVESGITELGSKLGPILWQLAPTKKFDPAEIGRFCAALPKEQDGIKLRHVLEVRHPSFVHADFVALAREHGVAICLALSDDYPLIADPTADFVYLRLQTSTADHEAGYDQSAIDGFAAQAKTFAAGKIPADLPTLASAPPAQKRDCYVYFISGAKERNPHAARLLIGALT